MDLSAHVERMLVTPFREVKVDVSITLDNGELGTFIGYRVQHDNSARARQGRAPLPPTVDLDEVAAPGLADDVEDGGGEPALRRRQGRHRVDPKHPDATRARAPHPALHPPRSTTSSGPQRDIPAPDMDTNAQTMAWIMDEYSSMHGSRAGGGDRQAGRPRRLAGPRGGDGPRRGDGARGVPARRWAGSCRHAVRRPGLRQRRLVAARLLARRGGERRRRLRRAGRRARPRAASTSPTARARADRAARSPASAAPSAITNEELLSCRCDVLVPAALGGSSPGQRRRIRARHGRRRRQRPDHARGRRDPRTSAASSCPDILANAGGVTVCTSSGRRTSSSSRGTRSALPAS